MDLIEVPDYIADKIQDYISKFDEWLCKKLIIINLRKYQMNFRIIVIHEIIYKMPYILTRKLVCRVLFMILFSRNRDYNYLILLLVVK